LNTLKEIPICTEDIELALSLSASYLFNNIHEDGSFTYKYDPFNRYYHPSYNILRHAGTLYSLCQWLNHVEQPNNFRTLLDKAFLYLRKRIVPLKEDEPNLLCIEENAEVKLGGAALFLIALIEFEKVTGDSVNRPLMNNLGEFIIWMQEPSGHFHSKYFRYNNHISRFESLYYTGEAVLSLIRLYKLDNNVMWLNAVMCAINYIINIRDKNKDIHHLAFDQWSIIALSELYEIKENFDYSDHLNKMLDSAIVPFLHWEEIKNKFNTGYIATRAEALVGGIVHQHFLKRFDKAKILTSYLNELILFCIQSQYNSSYVAEKNLPISAIGGFFHSRKNPIIRIDTVQHVISALIGYQSINKSSNLLPGIKIV
jgi:hypothetical protein